jgi:protein O-GlcNAc transferase
MNNIAKLSPETLALWANILHSLSYSRLVMTNVPEGSARQVLLDRFAQQGIASKRISFHGILQAPQFKALSQYIDIVLDPFPHNGLTTTCSALWSGIPTVSLCGETFVSRFGFVLLKVLKLDELVAHSSDDYVRIVSELALNLPRLSVLRSNLRQRFMASPLRDELTFTRCIELAYRSMWHTWCVSHHRY